MLRVCHILHGIYSTDPRVKREVAALVEAGHAVDVLCLREEEKSGLSFEDGARIYRVKLGRRRGSILRYLAEYASMFFLSSLFLAARLRKYDIIHVNNMPDFLVFSTLLPKLFGTRVLLDIHDPMPELFQSKYGLKVSSPVIRLLDWQERMSTQFADVVLTVSDEMRKRLESKVARKQFAVAMNLPDEHFIHSVSESKVERRNRESFRLLHTGTVSERYGLATVVQALPALREKIPNIALRIVGEGDQLADLRLLAAQLGVDHCVEFTGRVPFSAIPEMIADSDIGISALLKDCHTDLCFVTKVAEYIATGLPVISSRTEAMESYYDDETVRFFDAGNFQAFQEAVVELYNDPDKRDSMSRRGVEISRTANWTSEKLRYLAAVGATEKAAVGR